MTDVSDRRTVDRLVDAGTALALATLGVAEVWVPFSSVQGDGSRWLSSAVVVLGCAALAFRRVAPLATALWVLGLWPVVFTLQPILILFWGQFVPMVVAVYSVARHGRHREPVYGALAGAATLLYVDLLVEVLQSPGEIVFHWLVFSVAWGVGNGLRVAAQRAADSLRRAVEAEVAAAERAMAAVVEERTRIARELHDVVAHSMSVIVVQAGAAEQLVGEEPDRARDALATIRTTGAEALAEMRRAVAVLRGTDDPGALEPQPGLAQISSLVDDARAGGLEVTVTLDGRRRSLPAGLDLAAYRVVQEALTNVRRHADASHARVHVRYRDDALEVEVEDDGRGGDQAGGLAESGSGHGLVGMRERVGLYGGHLSAAPRPDGGFLVRAVLPLTSAPAVSR